MSIADDDIVFYRAQRPTDFDDGGGLPSPAQVEFGRENNVFPDLAELDMTGVTRVRTLYAIARAADAEPLLSAYSYIARPPVNPNVSVALLPAPDWGDERATIVDRSARDLVAASLLPGRLLGTAVEGATLLEIQTLPTSTQTLAPGDRLVLSYHEGQADAVQQYVRVERVEEYQQAGVDSQGEFVRRVLRVTVVVADQFQRDFPGSELSRVFGHDATTLRLAISTGAARLWGVQPLLEAAALGALSTRVPAIRQPLAPSATVETALADLPAAGARQQFVQAGASRRLATAVSGSSVRLGRALAPGSVSITGTATLTDTRTGTATGGGLTASIDYAGGEILLPIAGTWTVDAAPAAAVTGPVDTAEIAVTTANRGSAWAYTADPLPAPGTVYVAWRSGSSWYLLTDDGAGTLRGLGGAGSVNYSTGAILPSTTEQPDVGTSVIFGWSVSVEYHRRDGGALALDARYRIELPPGLAPGSVAASWTSGGQARALAVAADGTVSGHASGRLVHSTGAGDITYQYLPDPGTQVHWTFSKRSVLSGTIAAGRTSDHVATLTLPPESGPIRPGGLRLTVRDVTLTQIADPLSEITPATEIDNLSITDDGAGRLLWGSVDVGAIDYVTRAIVCALPTNSTMQVWETYFVGHVEEHNGNSYNQYGQRLVTVAATISLDSPPLIDWAATVDAAASADSVDLYAGPIVFTLPQAGEIGVPGSLSFDLGSDAYWEINGVLYRSLHPATGAGIAVGAWDAAAGVVAITVAPSAAVSGGTLRGLLTRTATRPTTDVVGYVSGAPLKPGVTQVLATTIHGEHISATDPGDGTLSATLLTGSVDAASGLYRLRFGRSVPTAELTAADLAAAWYSPANVANGAIWKPAPVLPESVRITTVAISSLPLPGDRVGVPAQRLRPDGTLVIFRPGDAVIAHWTGAITGPAVAGNVVNLGRERLQRVRVLDAAGRRLPSDRYTLDLDAGLLTWATPLDVSGYTGPFRIEPTIADVLRLRAVEPDPAGGYRLTFTRRLSHDFPIGAYISTCQEHGTLQARTSNLHAQAAWLGTWSDDVIGADTAFRYDDATHPIQVSGAGAVEGHWRVTITGSGGAVSIYERQLGLVAIGDVDAGLAPVNPVTGVPYWEMAAAGFSLDRTIGATIIFRTHPTGVYLAVAQCVQPDTPSSGVDSWELVTAGGVDA